MASASNKPSTDSEQVYRRVYADTHLLLLAGFLAVLVVAPGFMPALLGEDSWVEIPTALLAAAGAVLAFVAAARSDTARGCGRCIAFGALYLFVVGEENDWGIRLFIRRNMVSAGEGRSAREVNLNTVHELLFEVAPAPNVDASLKILAAAIALLLVAAVVVLLLSGLVRLWPPDRRTRDRGQRLTLVGCLLVGLGQLRDLGITPDMGLGPKFPEEVLELFGALQLLFAGWSLLLAAEGKATEAAPRGRGIWATVSRFVTDPSASISTAGPRRSHPRER